MAVRASRRPKPARCPAPAVQAPTLNQTANRSGSTRRESAGVRRRWRKRGCLPPRHGRTPPPPPPSIARGPSRGPSLPQACDCGGQSAAVLSAQARPLSATGSTRRSEIAHKTRRQRRIDSKALGSARAEEASEPGPTCCCTRQPAPFATSRASSPARIAAYTTVPAPKSHRVGAALGSSTFNTLPAQPQTSELLSTSVIPGRSEGCQRLTVLAVDSRSAHRPHRRAARSLRTCVHTF